MEEQILYLQKADFLPVKEEILEVEKELWKLTLWVGVIKGKVNTVTTVTFSHLFLFSLCLLVGVWNCHTFPLEGERFFCYSLKLSISKQCRKSFKHLVHSCFSLQEPLYLYWHCLEVDQNVGNSLGKKKKQGRKEAFTAQYLPLNFAFLSKCWKCISLWIWQHASCSFLIHSQSLQNALKNKT